MKPPSSSSSFFFTCTLCPRKSQAGSRWQQAGCRSRGRGTAGWGPSRPAAGPALRGQDISGDDRVSLAVTGEARWESAGPAGAASGGAVGERGAWAARAHGACTGLGTRLTGPAARARLVLSGRGPPKGRRGRKTRRPRVHAAGRSADAESVPSGGRLRRGGPTSCQVRAGTVPGAAVLRRPPGSPQAAHPREPKRRWSLQLAGAVETGSRPQVGPGGIRWDPVGPGTSPRGTARPCARPARPGGIRV